MTTFHSPGGAGNVHPSVANRSHSALPFADSVTQQRAAGIAQLVDIDEAEARSRARDILQDFAKHKARAADLENQLQSALAEAERSAKLLNERKAEMALERERWAQEREALRKERGESDARTTAAREEVRKVAFACAQRAADSASHLRLKEQETQQLEAELLRARDEVRTLRAELQRLQLSSGNNRDDIEVAQARTVDLARKIVDLEKAKSALERGAVDDRKQHQISLQTIDSMRRRCQDLEDQMTVIHKEYKVELHRRDLAAEMNSQETAAQREMYKSVVEKMAASNASALVSAGIIAAPSYFLGAGFGSPAGAQSPLSGAGLAGLAASNTAQMNQLMSENAVLKARLENAERSVQQLTASVDESSSTAVATRQQFSNEKISYTERLTELQGEVTSLRRSIDAERDANAHKDNEIKRLNNALDQLSAIHAGLQKQHDSVQKEVAQVCSRAQQSLAMQEELERQMGNLREELATRAQVEDQLQRLLQYREGLQSRLVEEQRRHQHELDISRVQLSKGGTVVINQANAALSAAERDRETNAAAAAAADIVAREMQDLRDRVRHFEVGEESRERENETAIQALQQELGFARQEMVKMRDHALQCQRDAEEWRAAFFTSEKVRDQLQKSLDEVRLTQQLAQKDKNGAELRSQMLQNTVEQLQKEVERERDELSKARNRKGDSP